MNSATHKKPSYAKVNLGLEVLGTRQDGYHELRTIFQTIDLHDDVTLRLRPSASDVTVRCDHPLVPNDATNLAARAAEALRTFAQRRGGVEITIAKRIPVAGGLGGGSSNAAAVLIGLDRLWKLKLGAAGLHAIAARLGADVPYFLTGGTALGLARGDEIYPLNLQVRAHVVVVDPARPVSTAAVFRRVDAELTPRENSYTIFRFISRHLEGSPAFGILKNDLERAALEEAPELAEKVERIRSVLARSGAHLALLSGSGSAYFGIFDDPARARRARAALQASGFRAVHARTVGLVQYGKLWSNKTARSGMGRARAR
jgi:4-diphosphocytidyl-2-C-methyl-D-erythritol kinase